jgi:hypothetical protein
VSDTLEFSAISTMPNVLSESDSFAEHQDATVTGVVVLPLPEVPVTG